MSILPKLANPMTDRLIGTGQDLRCDGKRGETVLKKN
jgi:hypothetical protein